MIIKHVGTAETDTGKLNDASAALLEAAEAFRAECIKYKRQFFLVLNPNDKFGLGFTFWSFLSEHMTPNNLQENMEKRELSDEEYNSFYEMINNSILKLSNGNIGLGLANSGPAKNE